MKQKILLAALFLFSIHLNAQKVEKPRLLITTDIGGDPDDQQSLVRLMVYACEFDMEGLISSSAGIPGELKEEMIRPELIAEIIDGYKLVYPNLLLHNIDYPAPDYLWSLIKKGNHKRGLNFIGEGHDTEGSQWIISSVDKKDSRPLNICIFGGQTDLAQALWKIKHTRTKKEYQKFISKIRIYDISDQDQLFNYIFDHHPKLFYVLSKAPQGEDKREATFRGMYLGGDESLTSLKWLQENVTTNHGKLGSLYPLKTWTEPNPHGVMKEGDTPSWFFFLKNGLNIPEKPMLGGWGGRFDRYVKGYYKDAKDPYDNFVHARATVYRWRPDFQNDWAARMDWCVKPFDSCNHLPNAVVNGSKGNAPLIIKAKPGKKLHLDASDSYDPDKGQTLEYDWSVYPNFGDASKIINADNSAIASISVPLLEKGEMISIILKVTDSGSPRLVAYRRILITNHRIPKFSNDLVKMK